MSLRMHERPGAGAAMADGARGHMRASCGAADVTRSWTGSLQMAVKSEECWWSVLIHGDRPRSCQQ